jgi:hypothetical protein
MSPRPALGPFCSKRNNGSGEPVCCHQSRQGQGLPSAQFGHGLMLPSVALRAFFAKRVVYRAARPANPAFPRRLFRHKVLEEQPERRKADEQKHNVERSHWHWRPNERATETLHSRSNSNEALPNLRSNSGEARLLGRQKRRRRASVVTRERPGG